MNNNNNNNNNYMVYLGVNIKEPNEMKKSQSFRVGNTVGTNSSSSGSTKTSVCSSS